MTIIQEKLRGFLSAETVGLFEASSNDASIRCDFSSIDSMACAVQRLAVDFSSSQSAERLRDKCTELSAKLTYLLEPLQIIECDEELSTVQMRSNPPQADQQARRYYELTATPSRLALCRFEKRPGHGREQINCVFTHEVVMRLVKDLAEA